jgi:hypothetical protein
MKIKSKIIILSVLLIGSIMITPALASTTQTEYQTRSLTKNPETITVEFIDCTGVIPVKKEITLSKTEWKSITEDLRKISISETTMKGTFGAQLSVFQKHNLVSQDINIDALLMKFNQKTNTGRLRSLLHQAPHKLPLNNTLFSAMSAITYTLENGTTVVLGLNTFINWIGFDIISFHKGYAISGIQTNGLISNSVPPGQYVGVMFGFFGYWFGEKTSTAVYSNVTVAGLTIITGWLQIA